MRTARRRLGVLGAAAVMLLGTGVPASSAEPDLEFVLDAGLVCSFPVGVAGYGDGPQVYREFTDEGGNVVRTIAAGTGYALTYTNLDTGATFSSRSNGGVARTTYHADGSSTIRLTGHNVVFLFPTDIPGPSATIHTGQAVITVAADGIWTLERDSGRQLDICAALDG